MSKQFEFGGKLKKNLMIFAIVGIVLGSLLALWQSPAHSHFSRFWANLLLNTYYFAGISIVGLFFVAAHQLGYGGWQTVFKKVPMAMGKFLYVIFFLVLAITIGMVFDIHHLYGHWSVEAHAAHDPIVQGKKPFLNKYTYTILVLGFFGLWALFAKLLNQHFSSVKSWKEYAKTKKLSALFLLVFGVSQSVLSWIFIMSLDPHWYSTLFGWYNFASYACGGFAMMILILLGLKQMGYMPNTTMDHIHDLGKYLFGFTVFWAYLWFSQFMLIWYANIPEATVWFSKRLEIPIFKFIFFGGFIISFIVPFLGLIARDSKRQVATIATIAMIVIFGHYLDFYQMIMVEPMAIQHHEEGHDEAAHDEHALNASENVLYAEVAHSDSDMHAEDGHGHELEGETLHMDGHADEAEHEYHEDDAHADDHGDAHGEDHMAGAAHGDAHGDDHYGDAPLTHASIGLPEILMFMGFICAYLFFVLNSLAGKELEITEDPFLKESLHHHI